MAVAKDQFLTSRRRRLGNLIRPGGSRC